METEFHEHHGKHAFHGGNEGGVVKQVFAEDEITKLGKCQVNDEK